MIVPRQRCGPGRRTGEKNSDTFHYTGYLRERNDLEFLFDECPQATKGKSPAKGFARGEAS
jgi:hypothetical protein